MNGALELLTGRIWQQCYTVGLKHVYIAKILLEEKLCILQEPQQLLWQLQALSLIIQMVLLSSLPYPTPPPINKVLSINWIHWTSCLLVCGEPIKLVMLRRKLYHLKFKRNLSRLIPLILFFSKVMSQSTLSVLHHGHEHEQIKYKKSFLIELNFAQGIFSPTKVLHFFNAPPDFSTEKVNEVSLFCIVSHSSTWWCVVHWYGVVRHFSPVA